MIGRSARLLGVGLLAAALLRPATAATAQTTDTAEAQIQMSEARRHFDALEYEQAVPALDRAIALLSARPAPDTRRLLASAYELRARSRFGLNDQNGARNDFVSMLKVDTAYTLSGQISPRVVALFDDARRATVTTARITVMPPTAEMLLDGEPIIANSVVPVVVGDHILSARRIGYKPGTLTFTAAADLAAEASHTLERASAVVAIMTAPPETEVVIDGVSRGKTLPGPPTAEYADKASRAGVPPADVSAAMIVTDVGMGSHRVEFRRPCYQPAERRVDVTQLDDYVLDPVKLAPAVSMVTVTSTQAGTAVIIDGRERGIAPYSTELCEGEHTIDLRSPLGRFSRKVDARAGQKIDIAGAPKPAFAIVSSLGQATLNTDLRVTIQRALEPLQSIFVFAPPPETVDQALKAERLPAEWLAFDGTKRPVGVSAEINTAMRKELSVKVSKVLDVQGVASVTIPSRVTPNRVVVSLVGAGSGEPDVLEISLDRPDTIASAIAQLDRPLAFKRPSIGLTTIDVADASGPIVIGVDAGGSAAAAGIQPGDVLLRVNDQAVPDTAALADLLASHKAEEHLAVELTDGKGAAKKADLIVTLTPRLIGMSDQTLLANRIMVDLRTRLTSTIDPVEESIVRLNLAATLIRFEVWSDARAELQRVRLPDGGGVSNGTVQYLLGLCADRLGNRAEAEAAWKAAAASQGLLTEDGPPVNDLAEAKLAELKTRPGHN